MRLQTAFSLLLIFVLSSARADESVYVRAEGETARLGNRFLELRFDCAKGYPLLASLRNKRGETIQLRDEGLMLILRESATAADREVPLFSFRLTGREETSLQGGGKSLSFTLKNEEYGLELKLCYELQPDDFFVRKRTFVRSASHDNWILYSAEPERLSVEAECELGGRGQPLFIGGNVFIGLEYPAGFNEAKGGKIILTHYPGKKLTREFLQLKTVVMGVSENGGVREAFAQYLRSIRIPPRTIVLYNSWYDLRRGELKPDVLRATFDSFRRNLVAKYGVRLGSFVIDDGWQNHQSIWEVDRKLIPDGFVGLSRYLERNGSRLGLWMPLTAVKHNLDLEWGAARGFELNDSRSHYCLAAPNYNRRMHEVIRHHIEDLHLNYYKHDFNSFYCAAEGHGHLPVRECGFEAAVDAYIEMLKYERKLNPDIFINITGGMWLSPWWLMYADTVWRGGSDTGRERGVPYLYRRDDTITYVDGKLYDNFVKNRYAFPPSALMTHGIVYGKRCMLGGRDEPLHRFAEHVISYLAPGLAMKELYVTPDILSDEQWLIIGRALRWAEENKEVLFETEMTHGNPHAGEVYGFNHVSGGRLIWFLRNPSFYPQTVELDIRRALGGAAACAEIVYPYRLSLTPLGAGDVSRVSCTVPPFQVIVVEASKDAKPTVEGVRYAIVESTQRRSVLRLYGERGTEAAVRLPRVARAVLDGKAVTPDARGRLPVKFGGEPETLEVIRRSSAEVRNRNELKLNIPTSCVDAVFVLLYEGSAVDYPRPLMRVNGKPVKPRAVSGSGWAIFCTALPTGICAVAFEVPVSACKALPFIPESIAARSLLFTRRKLAERTLELNHESEIFGAALPTLFAGIETDCIELQARADVPLVFGAIKGISDDELRNIKAAKLHFTIFGVQGEQYLRKPVLLNGEEIGILPTNRRPHDIWQEAVMDVPSDKLRLIKRRNILVLTNPTGDCYKVRNIALAVQLPDGGWVETNWDGTVYCTNPSWAHAEGRMFERGKSPEIQLNFGER